MMKGKGILPVGKERWTVLATALFLAFSSGNAWTEDLASDSIVLLNPASGSSHRYGKVTLNDIVRDDTARTSVQTSTALLIQNNTRAGSTRSVTVDVDTVEAESPYHSSGISQYEFNTMGSGGRLTVNGRIGSLGTAEKRLADGIYYVHGQGRPGGSFQTVNAEIGSINATPAGLVATSIPGTYGHTQRVNDVGYIDVKGDGHYRGGYGIYQRFGLGNMAYAQTQGQYVTVGEGIRVSGKFDPSVVRTSDFAEVTAAAGIINRSGNQVITSSSLNGARIDVTAEDDWYPAYSVLVYTHFQSNPSAGVNTLTTLRGNFNIEHGDLAVLRYQAYASPLSALVMQAHTVDGQVANTMTLGDDVNILVTNRSQDANGAILTDKYHTYALILGDSTREDDPGYEIRLGKNSYINVEGIYKGNGTLTFGSEWKDGKLEVNRNAVLLRTVERQDNGEASVLNLNVAVDEDKGKTADDTVLYLRDNALSLMKRAANNVIVGSYTTQDGDEVRYNVALPGTPGSDVPGDPDAEAPDVPKDEFGNEIDNSFEVGDRDNILNKDNTTPNLVDRTRRHVAGKVTIRTPEGLVMPGKTWVAKYYFEDIAAVGNPDRHEDKLEEKLNTAGSSIQQTGATGQVKPASAAALAEGDADTGNSAGEPESDYLAEKVTDENGRKVYTAEGQVYDYEEVEEVDKPWHSTTSTMDTIDSVGMTNYFLWRQENETLYQRMGEVRDRPELEGGWVRILNGRNRYDRKGGYFRNDYTGLQLGFDRFDRENDGKWSWGGAFTYTRGDSKLANSGSADNWIGSLSFYGTRRYENGGYLDLIVKASHMHNDFTAVSDRFRYVTKGNYHTNAWQASAEYGRKFHLDRKKEWYLDPQLQLTLGHINSVKYRTDNQLNVRVKGSDSVIGRIGMALGREWKQGSAFVKLDGLREFAAKYRADYSLDNGAENRSRISMKDTWGEVTVGGSYNFDRDTFGFMQVKRSFAADLQTDYRFDVGLRYRF